MLIKKFNSLESLREQVKSGKKLPRVLRMSQPSFKRFIYLISGKRYSHKCFYNLSFMGIPIWYVDKIRN